MSDFKLHILGCGSALPTQRHLPTAQVLELRGKLYLIDCGEGTQREIRRASLSFEAITAIFITHHHGDHIFGLPGLLSSMSMLGRTRVLHIVGPRGTKQLILEMQRLLFDWIGFDLLIEEYDDRKPLPVFEDRSLSVTSLPLSHRIPCQGYLFRERVQSLHLDKPSCDFYKVPIAYYQHLLKGEDYTTEEGELIPNSRLTRKGKAARTYAVCTDTIYLPDLHQHLRGVDTLYHEATYLDGDEARAKQTCHSTARQAAEVARSAEVGRLLLGHYSARYNKLEPFVRQAREVFPNVLAVDEGMVIDL